MLYWAMVAFCFQGIDRTNSPIYLVSALMEDFVEGMAREAAETDLGGMVESETGPTLGHAQNPYVSMAVCDMVSFVRGGGEVGN